MKKIFFILIIVFLFGSCVTTRYIDQYGNTHTITSIHPATTYFLEGVAEAIIYNSHTGYYYDNGYPLYDYNTGYLYQYEYDGHRYCRRSCTYRGRGHIHRYYNRYDGYRHVRMVTNQYYYGTRTRPPVPKYWW
jgi:hypothetical protein